LPGDGWRFQHPRLMLQRRVQDSLRLAAGGLLPLAALAMLLTGGCGSGNAATSSAPAGAAPNRHPSVIEMTGFVSDRLSNGQLTQRIMASRVFYDEQPDRQHARLENVKIEFYGTAEKPGMVGELWGDAAILYLQDLTTDTVKMLLVEAGAPDAEGYAARRNDFDMLAEEYKVQYRVHETGDTMLADRIRWNDAEQWRDLEPGVLKGEGEFLQLMFQENGMALLIRGQGFITEKNLKKWLYTKPFIENRQLEPGEIDALRPAPRPDAPANKPRS
jgi:hypothetical protein